jgi:ribose-phosphate pyrophosphokinase
MNMKTINLNTAEGVQITTFPDGQPHVNIGPVKAGEAVTVVCALTSPEKLLQLLQVANALDHAFAIKQKLVIPYLLGARYDRLMLPGDSVDVQVMANLINQCGFDKVVLFDVHSEVATLLINRAEHITNQALVMQYQQPDAVLICPDGGAAKKTAHYLSWNSHIKEVVYCTKARDLATGKINLQVLEPALCKGRHCVIVDDICDGGGTFLAIAAQIEPAHLALVVTHGIFSKGFAELKKYFHQIITSNSRYEKYDAGFVKTATMNYADF